MFNTIDLSNLVIINNDKELVMALVMSVVTGFMLFGNFQSGKEYYNSKKYKDKVKRKKALKAKKKEEKIKWQ